MDMKDWVIYIYQGNYTEFVNRESHLLMMSNCVMIEANDLGKQCDAIVAYLETLQVYKSVLQCVQHAMHVIFNVVQRVQ